MVNTKKWSEITHKLKPCPFCLSEAAIAFVMNPPIYIGCQKCGIEFTKFGATGSELIEAWNNRI